MSNLNIINSQLLYIKFLNIFNNLILIFNIKFYNLVLYINKKKNFINVKILKFNSLLFFESLLDGTVIDYIKKKKRFYLNFFFLSLFYNLRLILITNLTEFAFIKSVQYLYYSAIAIEREIWDLFGLYFLGNWNLKRILTDYGFLGKPLRKDFPVIGYLELIFDDSNKTIKFELIQLIQKYRNFEFKVFW